MSISPLDTTNSYLAQRDHYRDASLKNKKNYDDNVKNLEEHYENKIGKIRDNYVKSKSEDDDQYSANTERMSQQSADYVRDTKDNFVNKLNKEKKEINDNRNQEKKLNDIRLNDIKNNYQNISESEERFNDKIQNETKNNSEENVKNNQKTTEKMIMELKDRNDGKLDNLRNQYVSNIKNLNQDHLNKTDKLLEKQTMDKSTLLNSTREMLDKYKDFNKAEKETTQMKNDQNLRNVRSVFDANIEGNYNKAKNLFNKVNDDHGTFKKISKDKYAEQQRNMEQNYFNDLHTLREKMTLSNEEKERLSERNRLGDKEDRLDQILDKTTKDADVEVGKIYRQSQRALADQAQYMDGKIDRRLKEEYTKRDDASHYYEGKISDVKKKNEEAIEEYRKKITDQSDSFRVRNDEREKFNYNTIRDLNKTWDQKVIQIHGKEQKAFEELRDAYKEKNIHIRDNFSKEKENLSNQLTETFSRKINETNDMYEQQLNYLKEMKERGEQIADRKLEELERKRNRDIQYEQRLTEKKIEEHERTSTDNIVMRDQKHQTMLQGVRKGYEKKINDMLNEHSKRIKYVVDKYENQMENQRAEFTMLQQRQENASRRDFEILKNDYANRFENVEMLHEDQMDKLREHHEGQMALLKHERQQTPLGLKMNRYSE
jgi:hypothetical protein